MSVRAGEAGRQTARGRIPITRCSQIQSLAPTAGTVRHLPATPWIGCLLPRAAHNAVFRSAAKEQRPPPPPPPAATVRHLPATPWIGCLLPRAAHNAVFRSAAKDQSQLSPLRRVDPVNTGRVLGPARSHEVPRVCGDLGKLDDLLGALEQRPP